MQLVVGGTATFTTVEELLSQIPVGVGVSIRPCSHCQSCAGAVPICRISRVCERAMSAIKLDLISEN